MTQPDLKFEIIDEPATMELIKAEPQPIAVPTSEKAQIETRVVSVVEEVKALEVKTPADNVRMVENLRGVKALRAAAEAMWRPRIKQADALHDGLLADLRKFTDPLDAAEKMGKQRCLAYDDEVKRLKEEADRLQRAELARQAREYDEAVRKAAEDAAIAQAALDLQDAQRMEAELEQAEARGASVAEIEAIIEQPRIVPVIPVFVPAPFIAPTRFNIPEPPKAKGQSIARPYKGAVDTQADLLKVVQYIAQHPEYLNIIKVDPTALNNLCKAQGANLRIPGVRVFQDANMSIR
jgi:hypothetical protein